MQAHNYGCYSQLFWTTVLNRTLSPERQGPLASRVWRCEQRSLFHFTTNLTTRENLEVVTKETFLHLWWGHSARAWISPNCGFPNGVLVVWKNPSGGRSGAPSLGWWEPASKSTKPDEQLTHTLFLCKTGFSEADDKALSLVHCCAYTLSPKIGRSHVLTRHFISVSSTHWAEFTEIPQHFHKIHLKTLSLVLCKDLKSNPKSNVRWLLTFSVINALEKPTSSFKC